MAVRVPLYLSASAVRASLSDEEIMVVVSQTLRELNGAGIVKGPKSGFEVDAEGEHLHVGSVSGAVLSSSAVGMKWFAVSADNPSRNLPRVPATILICDTATGVLEGVLDGTQLTAARTAAMAVAAAAACSRQPTTTAAVIGAGAIGHALVKFLVETQPVAHVTVASSKESHARHACDAAAKYLQRKVILRATTDIREAVRAADVVFTATGVIEDSDLVRAEWLKEGSIVCSLGSRREVDLELISQACIIVDDAAGVKLRRSDFREGGAGWNRIAADLGSVMAGDIALPEDSRRIHLVLVGLGVLDVALGARAIANARRKGLGVALEPGRTSG